MFDEIDNILAQNPKTEELVVIFITDGQDGYMRRYGEGAYDEFTARIKSLPNMNSKFLAVGFSRDHDAVFMNKIANYGN